MSLERVLKGLGGCFLNLTERGFAYGPQGRMFLRNLESLWFLQCVTMQRYNVYLSTVDGFMDTLAFLRSNDMDSLPFGVAMDGTSKVLWNQGIVPAGCKATPHRIVKTVVMSEACSSKDLFHKQQREHKVWWRKLSQNPSRFMLTEAKRVRNCDTVEIEAQFPFGNITVETITLQHDTRKVFHQAENSKNNAVDMHMLEHVVSLDWGCLALLCDSYKFYESTEVYVHPKLAPYKVAFLLTSPKDKTDTDTEDLDHLVLYLNNTLRSKGIDTILTHTKQIVEMCLVPFVVTVDKTSLKNGIVHVMHRSTTIAEPVHITDLAKHIAMRC